MGIKADMRTRDKEGLARELEIPNWRLRGKSLRWREIQRMVQAVNGKLGHCKPMRQHALELPRIRSATVSDQPDAKFSTEVYSKSLLSLLRLVHLIAQLIAH